LRTALLCCTALALTASSAAAGSLQTWDKVFPDGAKRFKVLASFNGEAVLDKETGLVWQRAPSSTSEFDWATSVALCIGTAIGGRRGFRLPSAWELLSLKDPAASNPALTPGHPFEGIVSDVRYWSSTAAAGDAEAALAAGFASGGQGVNTTAKTGTGLRWCVRGPGGDSPGTP
jgi:hypothetical protein